MAVRKGGLGKGLDSLIPSSGGQNMKKTDSFTNNSKKNVEVVEKLVEKVVEKVIEKPVEMKLKISEVEPNREQPRKKFDEDALLELSESIKQFGVLQPLLVQKKKDYYEIIAGERRWRAAKMAGIKEVPVIIKSFTDQEVVEISLIENIQRENLNPIEEAMAYRRLIDEFHLKQDEIADRVSKSRTAVTNSMRLLKLDDRVQRMVIDEMITTGHARTLLVFEDGEFQYTVAMRIFDEKLSVRETEKLVKELQKPKKEKKPVVDTQLDLVYHQLEEKIKSIIGTKVAIRYKDNEKGKIEIEYYSQAELERLIELFEEIR
ncbi:MAG: ParB/RepB/Spo0J family partition protein [Clostridia bacterium]|nr:ParB/RepB/Spo0J family partition protein [Clostridia bacterium]